MCFHSVAHITAILSFYEVPGELFLKLKKSAVWEAFLFLHTALEA